LRPASTKAAQIRTAGKFHRLLTKPKTTTKPPTSKTSRTTIASGDFVPYPALFHLAFATSSL
jgi:hypothetical protein